jgi:LPXTG-site transpeptidase (sortase) family protein
MSKSSTNSIRRYGPIVFAVILLLVGSVSICCKAKEASTDATVRGTEVAQLPTPTAVPVTSASPKSPTPSPQGSSPAATPVQAPPVSPPLTLGGASTSKTASPAAEMDAASKMIPIPSNGILPKGPRKPAPDRLIIASIGLDTKVIPLGSHYNEQGELLWDTAPFAAGHHIGTANPGEPGNVVISGHISSIHEGAVFKRLPEIKIGDGVAVITDDRNYLYQVVDTNIVEPTQIEVMNATADQMLTLLTCFPDGIYSHRLVVTAKRI